MFKIDSLVNKISIALLIVVMMSKELSKRELNDTFYAFHIEYGDNINSLCV